jgi:hypothetical protein
MAATHKLQITFDEATGRVSAVHRCTAEVAGHQTTHAREVELSGDAAGALKSILDANREAVESETLALGVAHVAAVTGKGPKGVTPLKVGGSLGAVGGADAKK